MTSAMCVHAPSVCKAASSSRHLPHLPTQAAKLPVPPCHHTTTSRFFLLTGRGRAFCSVGAAEGPSYCELVEVKSEGSEAISE